MTEIPLRHQVQRMSASYPCLVYNGGYRVPAWQGFVTPTDRSREYLLQIEFGNPLSPAVRVLHPPISDRAKHTYPDGRLCLYFPNDHTWSPDQYVADVIVPLAFYWLYAYELWEQTGIWFAPEAPHGSSKDYPLTGRDAT